MNDSTQSSSSAGLLHRWLDLPMWLQALMVTALVFILHLSTRNMLTWSENYWSERVYWMHLTEYPFYLRPVTSEAMKALFALFGMQVKIAFGIVQFVGIFLTAFSFGFLLRELKFSHRWISLGQWSLGLSAPILLAFMEPIFTYDDFWGYILALWMLIFLIRGNIWQAALIACGFGIVKENFLFIAPVIFLFRDQRKSVVTAALQTALPFLVFVIYRFVMIGGIATESADMLTFNFAESGDARQSIYSLLFAYGPFWWFGFIGAKQALESSARNLSDTWKKLATSVFLFTPIVIASVILLARARETRLFFVAFCFVLPLGIYFLRNLRKKYKSMQVSQKPKTWAHWMIGNIAFTISIFLQIWLFSDLPYLPQIDVHRTIFAGYSAAVAVVLYIYFVTKRCQSNEQ